MASGARGPAVQGRGAHFALLAATGALWLCHGLLALADADSASPSSALDYTAVTIFSLALLALAPALSVLRTRAGVTRWGGFGGVALALAAAGAVIAGAGNFGEDALGVSDLGDGMYYPGVLLMSLGLLLLGIVLLRTRERRLAAGPLVTLLALFVLGDLAGIAVGPVWLWLAAVARDGARSTAV